MQHFLNDLLNIPTQVMQTMCSLQPIQMWKQLGKKKQYIMQAIQLLLNYVLR